MRILMFNNEFPPLGGGTATVNLMLFREWAQAHDLTIDLITSGTRDLPRREQFSERISIYRVRVNQRNPHHATHANLIVYTLLAFWKAVLLRPKKHYDLTMSWSTVPAGTLSRVIRCFYGLPYVVRIGGSDVPGHEQRYDR
ncbi:MAG: glycosyltransferase family 4 protein, partial [Verrucomicrobia bacterium]|nr:glycosyltransferase family 4 protein [Verrucomicrobiota bacterium]